VPYVEIVPSPALRPWVDCFWTRTPDAAAGEVRVLPDGCADLVFDLTDGEAMAVGTMTRPLVIDEAKPASFVGVRFRPGRAAAFLRIPLAEITDARVDLGDLWRDLPERVLSSADRIRLLEGELLQRLVPDRDARVDAAIEAITRGPARIDAIAREIGISRQHLARQFHHHVGVSPKTFARVMRFRRLVASLAPERRIDWAAAAAEHGYYDQSHLIDEFRELSGETPSAFCGR
jgi:AraC-like DNA-binding protein